MRRSSCWCSKTCSGVIPRRWRRWAALARRPERLRLLVLGTYRPAEVIARGHPLRQTVQELVAHRLCQELRLELLTEAQVQAYVAQRLGASPATAELGAMLYRRTDGNALFAVHLLDHLLQQGWLVDADGQWRLRDGGDAVEREVPAGLRALLLKQVEGLGAPAQQVLDAASVSGLSLHRGRSRRHAAAARGGRGSDM